MEGWKMCNIEKGGEELTGRERMKKPGERKRVLSSLSLSSSPSLCWYKSKSESFLLTHVHQSVVSKNGRRRERGREREK